MSTAKIRGAYFREDTVLHIWEARAIPTYRVYRLYNVYKEAGGSTRALSASELTQDRWQVYNARQHSSSSRPLV